MTDIHQEPWYQAALALVKERHNRRLDEKGQPYFQHFVRVADRLLARFPQASRAQVEAALLHDVLEDEGATADPLLERGIERAAICLIERITLPKDGRSYAQYVEDLIATGDIAAVQVKLADNLDALDVYGARSDPEALELMVERYRPAYARLEAAVTAGAGG